MLIALALVAAIGAYAHAPNVSIREYLATRSTRVVTSRTAEDNLTIRSRSGTSSLYGNNAPLYMWAVRARGKSGLTGRMDGTAHQQRKKRRG